MFTISGASVCPSLWAFRLLNHLLSFSCSFYLASIPGDMPLTWITFESVWCNMKLLLSPSLTVMERNDDLLGSINREERAEDSAVRGFWLRCSYWLLFASVRRPETSRALEEKSKLGGGEEKCGPRPQLLLLRGLTLYHLPRHYIHSRAFSAVWAWAFKGYSKSPAISFFPIEQSMFFLSVLLCLFLYCFKNTILVPYPGAYWWRTGGSWVELQSSWKTWMQSH